jgi:hypothetical protein
MIIVAYSLRMLIVDYRSLFVSKAYRAYWSLLLELIGAYYWSLLLLIVAYSLRKLIVDYRDYRSLFASKAYRWLS